MKSNKRINSGKRQGNPGYRTAATWRAGVQLRTPAKLKNFPPRQSVVSH